jgi:hypothetical protein
VVGIVLVTALQFAKKVEEKKEGEGVLFSLKVFFPLPPLGGDIRHPQRHLHSVNAGLAADQAPIHLCVPDGCLWNCRSRPLL